MASYNKTTIVGNLTNDPEYITTNLDKLICKFSIAANHGHSSNASAVALRETCFIEIVLLYPPLIDECQELGLSKGKPVLIEGRIKQEVWQDKKTNAKRSKHVIVANEIVPLY